MTTCFNFIKTFVISFHIYPFQNAGGNKAGNVENPPSTWYVDVFVDVVKELVPTLSWVHVIQELDHPEFIIKNPKGLQLIVFAYFKASPNSAFPMQYLYKPWINTIGQVITSLGWT